MCGIAGWIDSKSISNRYTLESIAAGMADTLLHRGPDDQGVWADPETGVALAHRRLSILDLSPAGHQPMFSSTGRFVISYNGEMYNCEEIRQQLRSVDTGVRLRGHSDTEVMLAAFEQWGIEPSLQRINGMFAFALWDRKERILVLARDRLGEKPLYYGASGGAFLFASQLKALRAHPHFDAKIDSESLVRFLQSSCVPAPYSIYQGIRKLVPGTILRYKSGDIRISAFWSVRACVERAASQSFRGSEAEAIEELDSLLRNAVRLRMHADVPVGAFLSGGIDSSLVVALMQAQSSRPVCSFTIGFEDEAYDESQEARAVALHLGTEHTEFRVHPAEAIGLIHRLPEIYDEPFGDSSQIPTLLVSQLARRQVTVSLSGDGGDEVFGGYNRYAWGGGLWHWFGRAPRGLRRLAAAAITAIKPQHWETVFRRIRPVLPASLRPRTPGYKLHKLAGLMSSLDLKQMYGKMASHALPQEFVLRVAASSMPLSIAEQESPPFPDFARQAMYFDTISYLPDDILVKLDRATMAFGLEGRIPFLDHRVVEFAWRLPIGMKVRQTSGKWILRQLLDRYVPRAIVERSKTGFGIPLDAWLRTSLRDWAEALLDPKRIRQQGFFDPAMVRTQWEDHLSGRGIWQHHLWNLLMFHSWLDHQSEKNLQATTAAV